MWKCFASLKNQAFAFFQVVNGGQEKWLWPFMSRRVGKKEISCNNEQNELLYWLFKM